MSDIQDMSEILDDDGGTDDGLPCTPPAAPFVEVLTEEPPPVVGEPPMQKFKVNARHTLAPNRWQTVEAKSEEEAKRVFLAQYGGEIIAVKPGEAKPNEK